ncbi:unnamed protein product [Penicillium salamii]|uniref:Xylanolytic transcriptional activator regulatory domain-containing protein n=1 Tax=Penicillium salamii TaxID=1612424 RepID=A0A9W4JK07_9EURO|nr:unnamed protein product [Penicillium salamii]CAG8135150.1 unnamed protein product [Penicillium salamii]CAG8170144.1 unnamed protein product [Penicillium salamii]CAG8178362.1 unnamed protein product [Penicillium salamii]CAG8179537.1 unnamed protein product [Penicillium salamii]
MAQNDPERVARIMLAWHSLELVTCASLQTLWAGYGQICAITARATTTAAAESLSKLCGVEQRNAGSTFPLILKLISPPRKSNSNADEGHLRKMLSYEVEQYFYSTVVPLLDEDFGIAQCLTSTRGVDGRKDEDQLKALMATIMVDLRPKYPVAGEKRSVLSHTQVCGALDWLARFHSRSRSLLPKSLESCVLPPLQESKRRKSEETVGAGLWLNGGYTYLATRRKEYASLVEDDSEWTDAMCKVPEGSSLSVAEMAALVLTPRGRSVESYIHGDVKSENLFTNETGDQVAFFDFQYVGVGLGVCDLAKLFTCSVPLNLLTDEPGLPEELAMCEGERRMLERYRNSLQDQEYDWETFTRHWETALVDWCRFQASWGFWGNTEWLEARVRCILADQSWREWLYQQVCDGNVPCKACISNKRDCQQNGTDMRGRWREAGREKTNKRVQNSKIGEVRDEQDLNSSHPSRSHPKDHEKDFHATRSGQKSVADESITPFSGETSLTHNITVVEGRLEQMGVRYPRLRSESPHQSFSSRFTPSPPASPKEVPRQQSKRHLLFQVLDSHKIAPDRAQWDRVMNTFCDEVLILVPFLHLPSVWEAYESMWDDKLVTPSVPGSPRAEWRFTSSYVLLCLANGTCVESSRVNDQEVQYSAGWSLYRAARDIFGDLLDVFGQCTNQILLLQNIILMVIYLFRLDAHGPAEKLLALAISHSHHIGLQRRQVVESMNKFDSEMARRLWWCTYLMDRRLAIETGRPFLIQDLNVDIGLPQGMSDELLSKYRGVGHSSEPDDFDTGSSPTTVPYLIAMVSYSRVIGKVWEALYGASTSDSTPSPLLKEYLELLATQSQGDLQPEFTYDPQSPGSYKANGLAWWQIKQQLMMRIVRIIASSCVKTFGYLLTAMQRWSSLYLLIRKPMLHNKGNPSLSAPETIENEVVCMRLAQSTIKDFTNIPEDHPKYTFPFLHYLTSAIITALGLIIKQTSFKKTYGDLTLEAARSLKKHCRRTWVSGKMARAVWKLNQMAEAILNPSTRSHETPGNRNQNLPTAPTVDLSYLNNVPRSKTSQQDVQSTQNQMFSDATHACHQRQTSQSVPLGHDHFISTHHLSTSFLQQGPRSGVAAGISHNMETGDMSGIPVDDSPSTWSIPSAQLPILGADVVGSDANAWFPGEIIDGGMEWLQGLYAGDLDSHVPLDMHW